MFDSTKGTAKEGRCSEVPLDCLPFFWNWKQSRHLLPDFGDPFLGPLGKKNQECVIICPKILRFLMVFGLQLRVSHALTLTATY